MKVVLFCGGQGMRLRGYSDQIPKPLVEVGARPILWHLMKIYAHHGHTDFILCLGYGAQHIKRFFLEYDECATNDFVFAKGGAEITPLQTDIHDWRITFVDTGMSSNIGERLRRVRDHIGDDEMFMANYADGLSDVPLDTYVRDFTETGKVAQFMTVPPPQSFHMVHTNDQNEVERLEVVQESDVRVNAGWFVFRTEIFDYMQPGEELVEEPFARLIEANELVGVPYEGFWMPMDTFKEKVVLDGLDASGDAPWQVWNQA